MPSITELRDRVREMFRAIKQPSHYPHFPDPPKEFLPPETFLQLVSETVLTHHTKINHPFCVKLFRGEWTRKQMALTEGAWYGRTHKDQAIAIYRKYMKIDDPKLLESMHKNYLLGTIPVKPYPKEEAIQNDIEDLSHTLPHLKGKKAGEFVDTSLLKSMEDDGFFKRLETQLPQ